MSRTSKELREKFKVILDLMPSQAVSLMEETLQSLQQAENLNSQLQTSLNEEKSAHSKLQAEYNRLYGYTYDRLIED